MGDLKAERVGGSVYRVGDYIVDVETDGCTCRDNYYRDRPCKHVDAARALAEGRTVEQIRDERWKRTRDAILANVDLIMGTGREGV